MRSICKFVAAFVVIAVCGFIFMGCKDRSTETAKDSSTSNTPTTQIAVIAKSTVNAYWKSVEAGARKAAAELNVTIIWTGPDAENNHTQQAAMVDNMANKGVSGIVIAPTNVDALVRPVESAVSKGIPVILIDSALHSDKPVCVIATDNYAAGRQAAEALIAAMPKGHKYGGKVIMLRFLEGSGSTEPREKGFADRIGQEPGLTLAASAYTKGGGSTTEAADTADALLRRFTSDNVLQVDGVFASNQPTAIGMMRKLDQFRAQGVKVDAAHVGFDTHEVFLQGIRDGKVSAVVVQDPIQKGYLGVKSMVRLLGGQSIPKSIPMRTATLTRENIDTPEIKAITAQS